MQDNEGLFSFFSNSSFFLFQNRNIYVYIYAYTHTLVHNSISKAVDLQQNHSRAEGSLSTTCQSTAFSWDQELYLKAKHFSTLTHWGAAQPPGWYVSHHYTHSVQKQSSKVFKAKVGKIPTSIYSAAAIQTKTVTNSRPLEAEFRTKWSNWTDWNWEPLLIRGATWKNPALPSQKQKNLHLELCFLK